MPTLGPRKEKSRLRVRVLQLQPGLVVNLPPVQQHRLLDKWCSSLKCQKKRKKTHFFFFFPYFSLVIFDKLEENRGRGKGWRMFDIHFWRSFYFIMFNWKVLTSSDMNIQLMPFGAVPGVTIACDSTTASQHGALSKPEWQWGSY